jgi:hypothetical protein
MKRFDLAAEVAKQLITIASAIITVVIAFYEKFFSHSGCTFAAMVAALFVFIVSIGLGVLSIGGVTTLVEDQERDPKGFFELRGSSAQKLAIAQQVVFTIGLILFLVVAAFDLANGSDAAKEAGGTASAPTKLSTPIVWAQLRPDGANAQGQLIARAIVSPDDNCPNATFEGQGYWNGKSWPMAERWTARTGAFAIKICEIAYPGQLSAKIGQVRLEPRPADPKVILVIGDTGCRLTMEQQQDCSDAQDWPFARTAATARIAKPDLIIHVGDYHYREAPCPASMACADSPYGDNWATWLRDFFQPAEPMLARAPWIMVRGNHEGQTRAGPGFQLLLSPQPRPAIEEPWADDAPPYQLQFRRLTMTVVDVANSDGGDDDRRRETYVKSIKSLLAPEKPSVETPAKPPSENWLLIHKPLWVHVGCNEGVPYKSCPGTVPKPGKDDPIDAIRALFKPATEVTPPALILSGDTHVFEMFAPDDPKVPDQLIAGMSGTALEKKENFDPGPNRKLSDETLSGVVGKLWVQYGFGYLVLDKEASGWIATLYDVDGRRKVRCNVKPAPGADVCAAVTGP